MDGADRKFLYFAAAYGLGHFGKSLFWSCGEGLFVFYLTEICGLSPGSAGLVAGSALQFSAIVDLLLLRLCRRPLARTEGVLRLQAAGAVLSALFFLLFALTARLPAEYRLAAALCGSLAFRAAYAVLDVPQNALMGLAAESARQRSRLASIRMMGSGLAGLAISGLAYFMILGVGASGTGAAAGIIGLIAILGAVLTMRTAPRSAAIRDQAPFISRRGLIPAGVARVLAIGVLGAAASTLLSKLVPYFAAYGLRSPSAGGLLMAAEALGGVLSQPFWLHLGNRWTRRGAIQANCLVLLVSSMLFYPASFAGLWMVLPCALGQGVGIGGLGMSVWAALGDEARSRGGGSSSAVFLFALLTFLSKSALAAAALGLTLTLAAHPHRSDWPLLSLICLCPIVMSGLCLAITRFRI